MLTFSRLISSHLPVSPLAVFLVSALIFIPSILPAQEQNTSLSKDTVQIKEIVVSGSRDRKMTGMLTGKTVFNPEALEKLPSILGNTDVLKLLELTPGVQNAGDGNTNLYVRGGDPGQNLLLYNDVPVYTQGHLLGFFSLFNADHLSVLEMHKSAIDAGYGGRLSSVVSVRSKNIIPEKAGIQGSVGLLSSQATVSTPIGKNWAVYLSGRKTYISLLMNPLLDATINNNAENRVDDTAYDFYDGNFTLAGRLSSRDEIRIDAFMGKDHLDIVDDDILLNGTLIWENRSLSAHWSHTFNEEQNLSQTVFYTSYENHLSSFQAKMGIDLFSDITDWGYKNNYTFRIGEIALQTGIQYTRHDIQPQSADMQNLNMVFQGRETEPNLAHDFSTFLSGRLFLWERLTADLGIRYNLFAPNSKTFHSIDPRLSFRYRIKENQYLRTSYTRQNQYVNLLSPSSVGIPTDFWICATDQIKPQSGNAFSAGYYQTFAEDMYEFSADIYFRTLSGVTEYDQNLTGAYDQPFTAGIMYGKGKAYGLEILLKKNYGKFTGWIAYTLGHSDRTFDGINRGKTFPAEYDRLHDLSVVTSYTFNPRWDLSVVCVYASGNAYTLPSSWYFINNNPVKQYGSYNGARMPDYNRTDLSLNYWFKKDNGINFSVFNIFMVNNPVYIFMNVRQDPDKGTIFVDVKRKKLATIVPSVSWRFKF